jgi:hypothetical protein
MKSFFRSFLQGFGSVLFVQLNYRTSPRTEIDAIGADFRRVGLDLASSIERHKVKHAPQANGPSRSPEKHEQLALI